MPDGNSVTLLAFDFEGALASAADDAALQPGVADFLARAAGRPGIVLAIASDRDAGDLQSTVGAIPAYLISSHGLEIRDPQGTRLAGAPRARIELDPITRHNANICGFRVEEKPDAIALHWRGVPYLHARHPVVERFRSWARANELELIEGDEAVQARRGGVGKDAALRWLSGATAAGRVTMIRNRDDLDRLLHDEIVFPSRDR